MDREAAGREFGLSYARVNHLIRQYDGDVEQIVLSREKNKKTIQTEKNLRKKRSMRKILIILWIKRGARNKATFR